MKKERIATSDVLEGVVKDYTTDLVSLNDIKNSLHERGFGLLMVLFSFPIAIPLPYPPGMTAIVGIPLVLFSLQMMLGFDSPWLPKWLGNKSIKRSTLAMMIEKSAPYLRKVERFLHPRLIFTTSRTGERIVGFFCFLCAVSVALPIPMGNAIPSAGILLMSLGLLSKDGLMIFLGIAIGLLGIFISGLVVVFGIEAAKMLFGPLLGFIA